MEKDIIKRNIAIIESFKSTMEMVGGIRIPNLNVVQSILVNVSKQPNFIEGTFLDGIKKELLIKLHFLCEDGQKSNSLILEIYPSKEAVLLAAGHARVPYKFKYLNKKDVKNIVEVVNEEIARQGGGFR